MKRKPLRGRADLVRALRASDLLDKGECDRIADLIGYQPDRISDTLELVQDPKRVEAPQQSFDTVDLDAAPLADIPFFYASRFQPCVQTKPDSSGSERSVRAFTGWRSPPVSRPLLSVAPWKSLEPKLRQVLAPHSPSQAINTERAVNLLAQSQLLTQFPKKLRRHWTRRLTIIQDRSPHLIPFFADQRLLTEAIKRQFPACKVTTIVYVEAKDGFRAPDVKDGAFADPCIGDSLVLVMGDLGRLGRRYREGSGTWHQLGQRLGRSRAIVLSPLPASLLPPALLTNWRFVEWDSADKFIDEQDLDRQVQRLLILASPAVRIEPQLLRALRLALMPKAPALIEALVWRSAYLSCDNADAAMLHVDKLKEFRDKFEREDIDTRRKALALIRLWRGPYSAVWFEEILSLSEVTRVQSISKEDCEDAESYFSSLHRDMQRGGLNQDVRAWLSRIGDRAENSTAQWQNEDFCQLVAAVKQEQPGYNPPVPLGAFPISQLLSSPVCITQLQDKLAFSLAPVHNGSPFGLLSSRDGRLEIIQEEDRTSDILAVADEYEFWGPRGKPEWVSSFGEDAFGLWTEFTFDDVIQRMRWINPGRFLMGSPESETERYDDEGPQHEVTISQGFWLFDTACTQALWQAVMGDNPSQFKDPSRPVETVSWDDVQQFLRSLNDRVPGLNLSLPSEAQWEYACWAGTITAFSFGANITPEQVNYNGDYPYPGGAKGLNRKETVPVGSLPANPWGLYEMHGNVDEWCADGRRSYEAGAIVDPIGPMIGVAKRVLRGGAWGILAQSVRSASRLADDADYRGDGIGFRCARVQDGAEPEGRPASPAGGAPERSVPSARQKSATKPKIKKKRK